MGEDGLDFGAAKLENVVEGATRPFSFLSDAVLPWGAVALFVLAIVFSVWIAKRSKAPEPNWRPLSTWPLALRAALWPLLTAFALTHAFAAGSVYYTTKIANPSTEGYFADIGVGRLLSLSHAHLFAHATMYFLMALLVQFTRSGRFARLWAPILALWSGVFDVFSWWGLKEVSSRFEVLSAFCGSSFSLAFVLMSFAILRESLRKDQSLFPKI